MTNEPEAPAKSNKLSKPTQPCTKDGAKTPGNGPGHSHLAGQAKNTTVYMRPRRFGLTRTHSTHDTHDTHDSHETKTKMQQNRFPGDEGRVHKQH